MELFWGLPREGRARSRHLSFYTAAPLSLCCNNVLEVYKFSTSGLAEFIFKGKSSTREVEFDWLQFVNSLLKLGWLQWIGAAIFFWGWIHQHRCHAILSSIRHHSEQNDEYVIPHGDWFEIVSSPHYQAEMLSLVTPFTACLRRFFFVSNNLNSFRVLMYMLNFSFDNHEGYICLPCGR